MSVRSGARQQLRSYATAPRAVHPWVPAQAVDPASHTPYPHAPSAGCQRGMTGPAPAQTRWHAAPSPQTQSAHHQCRDSAVAGPAASAGAP
uniref:Uncharacterized protein n=1 Tax=Ulva partita TaxID=1605170 RepID=A0A1C9ZWE2_9CHLO|nr:hypothetical protein [Ulva partita]